MATVCPYCNIEVSESSIEAEDGCCPECGAVIGATHSFLDDHDGGGNDYEYEEDGQNDVLSEFDDEDDNNDFSRSEYEDDIFEDEMEDELDSEFDDGDLSEGGGGNDDDER